MKRNYFISGFSMAVAIGVALTLVAPSHAATAVSVPGGTTVVVHLNPTISSSTVKQGDTFQISAVSPTVVKGWIVFKQGAVGQGHVVSASPAGKSGRQGTLSIQFDWIYAADGQQVRLAGIVRNRSGKNKTGTSNTANVAGTILLGPVGLFAHNFVKGRDISVGPDTKFSVYIKNTTTIMAAQKYSSGM